MDEQTRIGVEVGFDTDEASVNKAKAAAATVDKALKEIDRSKALAKLAEDAAKQAKATGDSARATAQLVEQLKKAGASAAEVKKVQTAYEANTRAIEQQEQAVKQLQEREAEAARKRQESQEKSNSYETRFRNLSDSVDPAGQVTSTLGAVGGALSGAGLGGAGEAVGAAAGITDLIENLPRLKASVMELPNAIKSAATEIGVGGGVIAIALAAIALAVAEFQRQAAEQAEQLNAIFEQRRSVLDEIASGATSEDIEAQIEKLKFRRELEADVLADSTKAYEDFLNGVKEKFGIFGEFFVKLLDNREEALADQVNQSQKLIQESEAKERAYQKALDDGLTSKADAKKAEEDLSKSRDTSQRAAEQAADKAGREQERVNAEAARAAEKAAAESQRIAEQAAAAQSKYSQAVQDAGRTFTNSIEDIGRKSKQTSADLTKTFGRDLLASEVNNARQVAEVQLKTQRGELARLKEHGRKVEDITRESFKSEEKLRQGRNFIAIADARDAQREQYDTAQRELKRATDDAGDEYREQRIDLQRSLQQQQADRRTAYAYQRQDQAENVKREIEMAGIAKKRNLETAQLAYQRDQELLQRHLQAMSGLRQQSYAGEAAGGFNGAVPSAAGANASGGGNVSNVTNNRYNNIKRAYNINTNSEMQTIRLMSQSGY